MNRIGNEGVVVVENGQVVGKVHQSEAAAEAEAAQRKKLLEQLGTQQEQKTVEVRQQIFG